MAQSKNVTLRKIVQEYPTPSLINDGFKPRMTFKFSELPAAKSWKNGSKYQLLVEVEQVSSNKESASFTVLKVGDNTAEETAESGK